MFAGLNFRVLDYVISHIFKSLFFLNHDTNKHGNNGSCIPSRTIGSMLR